MEELLAKVESMLEPVLEEERRFIDELCLEEEYDCIEDIPIDEPEVIDYSSSYGWQVRRDYRYIEEKKGALVNLKELISVMTECTDKKKKHRARKELELLITDARYFIYHKKEDIDEANKVIDIMDNVIEISQSLVGKKK